MAVLPDQQPFSIPYRPFVDGDTPRPYLVMEVTGINGSKGAVMGIVDSGADTTCLPFGYASLMGYDSTLLVEESFTQASGSGVAYRATKPCVARVPEIPDVEIEIFPQFIQGADMVLWGRMDFMKVFEVTIREAMQTFVITAV